MNFLYKIAAINEKLIKQCPKTDQIWGAQLGLSLILAFILNFFIITASTSYFPVFKQYWEFQYILVTVITLIIVMIDRTLYQSDWYLQGYFKDKSARKQSHWETALAVVARIGFAVAIAIVLSGALLLYLFEGEIINHIEQETREHNKPFLDKVKTFRKQEEQNIADKYKEIDRLRGLLRSNVALEATPATSQIISLNKEIANINGKLKQLNTAINQKQSEVSEQKRTMIAENYGTQLDSKDPSRFSGIKGCGKRCKSAKKLAAIYEGQLKKLLKNKEIILQEKKMNSIEKKHLFLKHNKFLKEEKTSRKRENQDLEKKINKQQADATYLKNNLNSAVRTYRKSIEESSGYKKLSVNGLAIRYRAFQKMLKDPDDGSALAVWSISIKLVLILLDLAPLLSKMFWAPPSSYGIHLQKEILKHQELDLSEKKSQKDINIKTQQTYKNNATHRKVRHLTIVNN